MNREFRNEAREKFNKIAIAGSRLCRIIGYAEDGFDCYWITKEVHGESRFVSMALKMIFLDSLPAEDLNSLESLLSLNGCPENKKFMTIIDDSEPDTNEELTLEDMSGRFKLLFEKCDDDGHMEGTVLLD